MRSQNIIWLGLLFGIISTSILHLAKAMERHGIETLSRDKTMEEKGKKPLIYIIGLILNNTIFIWQIIGMSFASAAVFSSVFGLGLIILMLYSHYILKEEIRRPELIGAFLILIGTLMVGLFYVIEEPMSLEVVNYSNFYILLIIILIIFTILITFSLRTGLGIAFIFGIVAGSFGAIDNVFKRIGLVTGNISEILAGIFELNPVSMIFLLSFVVGLFAFIFTQIGFAKGAHASQLVPMYNSFYIITPIIFELVILEGATISLPKIIAIIIIVIGMFVMNIFKEPETLKIDKLKIRD